MYRYVFLAISLCFCNFIFSQEISDINIDAFHKGKELYNYSINLQQLRVSLESNTGGKSIVNLEDEKGESLEFETSYVQLLDKSYESQYNIKSYRLKSVNKKIFASGRLCITPFGMSATIVKDGKTLFIESDANGFAKAYNYTKDLNTGHKHCGTEADPEDRITQPLFSINRVGESLKIFKIAIASSGEFSNKRANNLATINADIATYLSALNAIYEIELSVNLILATNNNNIIFFDPITDGLDVNNPISTAQTVIGNAMPTTTYDLGHVLHEITVTGGGYTYSGIAGLGVICSTTGFQKASGWTGIGGAYNLSVVMEVFLHEVGHQFGAHHSFYGTSFNCNQRSPSHGYEPGSGNTIMSYEGNCQASSPCTNHNITPFVNSFYFNAHSTDQILSKINMISCYTTQSTGNTDPVANVGPSISIPKGTPFILTGTATDVNNDVLSYNWEEYDTDNLSLTCPAGAPNDAANSTSAPCFRSFDPGNSKNVRSFPKESDVLANSQTLGEILPNVARTMKFRMSVKDGNGGVTYGEKTVNIINTSGGFAITNLNTITSLAGGTSTSLTWSVNGTNASPINCSNVKILLSLDGGLTYPIVLLASTANDGTENISLPNFAVTKGRIKIEAIGNVFYDVNNADITITSTCNPGLSEIINSDSVIANPGDAVLDLTPIKGNVFSSISGTLATSDPTINLTGKNLSSGNTCIAFSLLKNYDLVTFKASKTGNYTFILNSAYVSVVNFYNTTYNSANGCTNWFNSTMDATSTGGGNFSLNFQTSITIALTAGNTYVMQVTNYNGLGAYNITYSNPQNGKLYSETNVPPSGFSYTYVIQNKSSGNIIAIDASANLSNAGLFPGGEYKVWGLSNANGTNLSTYVGGAFSSLEAAIFSGAFCGYLSSNFIPVKINSCSPGTKTVTSSSDTNTPGTLRYILANVCPGDIIVFSPSVTGINLNSAIVISTSNSSINGPGKSFVLSGSNTNRIFDINPGIVFEIKNIALKNAVSVTNGGAIYNQGNLTLDNVLLQNNLQGSTPKAYTSTGTVIVKGATEIKL
jgi:hypothetical protein